MQAVLSKSQLLSQVASTLSEYREPEVVSLLLLVVSLLLCFFCLLLLCFLCLLLLCFLRLLLLCFIRFLLLSSLSSLSSLCHGPAFLKCRLFVASFLSADSIHRLPFGLSLASFISDGLAISSALV